MKEPFATAGCAETSPGQRHRPVAETDLLTLPVFSVVGGERAEQEIFLSKLTALLTAKNLQVGGLAAEEEPDGYALSRRVRQADVVFLRGASPLTTHRLLLGGVPEEGCGDTGFCLDGRGDLKEVAARLCAKLDELILANPVYACILIGGRSSRMGRPKHLLPDPSGRTWLAHILATVAPLVTGIALSGRGDVPPDAASLTRLPDIPGVTGPLTGLLAAGRWLPQVSWLVVACDMPCVNAAAVQWLLAGRRAGRWGLVPRLAGAPRVEPLLAWYDFRAMPVLERYGFSGGRRLVDAVNHPRIEHPEVPEALRAAWQNINTPEQLAEAWWQK
jgi:molybdopterin-guanine dinucleotide biosynthesis protein A